MKTTTANLSIQNEVKPKHSSHSDWPQEIVQREVQPAPDRYRNAIGK